MCEVDDRAPNVEDNSRRGSGLHVDEVLWQWKRWKSEAARIHAAKRSTLLKNTS